MDIRSLAGLALDQKEYVPRTHKLIMLYILFTYCSSLRSRFPIGQDMCNFWIISIDVVFPILVELYFQLVESFLPLYVWVLYHVPS